MMKFVLSHELDPEGMRILKDNSVEIFIANSSDPESYLNKIQEADGYIIRLGKFSKELMQQCPNLKVIGRTGVGYDNIDVKCASLMGIPVVVTPGANNLSVAEHTMAMIFSLAKNIVNQNNEIRKGNWSIRDAGVSFELNEKKIGIIGVGSIGRILASMCRGLGMKVAGMQTGDYPIKQKKEEVEAAGCEFYDNLDDLLKDCDIVSIHIPLTPQTKNLIGWPQMNEMKPTSILINNSRGGIVNEKELVKALNLGIIAGAGIDVYTSEPVEKNNILFTAKNLICTPHSAALTREGKKRMAKICVESCLNVIKGIPVPNIVKA